MASWIAGRPRQPEHQVKSYVCQQAQLQSMNMDRFRPETAADNKSFCVCCGEIFDYTRLNDVGECPYCRDEENENQTSQG